MRLLKFINREDKKRIFGKYPDRFFWRRDLRG